jgi:glutathione gamma-glutamylcysteinyltransferase
MRHTVYRRPLPQGTVPFASSEGRKLFAEALAAGGLEGYFALAEQFHTQSDPAYCGLGSLVVVLNALGIDPQRLWKGPWRWFAEDLLDCCVPLELVRSRGINLEEFACLARCNSADVQLVRAEEDNHALWRDALVDAASGERVVVASYDRRSLGQTGSGHFSPIGGYHAAGDLVLILDVARFKYPPHWVPAEQLWAAMQSVDPTTGQRRGWLALKAASRAVDVRNAACCARPILSQTTA